MLADRLEQLWKRSESVGVCSSIPVSFPQAVASLKPASLRDARSVSFSTIGGDTRSFAQVLKSNISHTGGMGDSRNFGTRKPQHPNERENFGVEEVGEKTFSMRGVSIKGTGMIENEVSEVVDSLTFSGGRDPLVGGVSISRTLTCNLI